MKQISLKLLDRQVRKTTWVPIATMAFLFLVAVAVLLYAEQENRFSQIKQEFSDTIDLNKPFIAQEAMLGMRPALRERVFTTISKWAAKYPRVDACMHLTAKELDVVKCTGDAEQSAGAPWIEKKVDNGIDHLATIQYRVIWQKHLSDYVPLALLLTVLMSVILALILHGVLVDHLKKRIVTPLVAQIKQDERNEIVAQAVRFITHDVRRPFNRLKKALQTLNRAEDKNIFLQYVKEILPEIQKGMISVNDMVKDVYEVGNNIPLDLKSLKPMDLMNDAIVEIYQIHTHADVEFSYDFTHEHEIMGEREKLMRVLLNLIENASQATEEKGRIWIHTREVIDGTRPMTEFCIGNNGPAISEEDQQKLFKMLFTKRQGGTGIGLAIVKKIIEAHGGEIFCRSSEKSGTEFVFTIPSSSEEEHTATVLPSRSIEVTIRGSSLLPNIVVRRNQKNGSPKAPNVLVFDDDHLVHSSWQICAKEQNVPFLYYWSWEDFLRQGAAEIAKDATAFVDLGFKGSDFNGFDIARRLRMLGVRRLYAITGNPEKAITSGLFDQVLGKEVPRNIKGLVA